MKVVDPEGSLPGSSRTHTFTQRLLILRPAKDDLVDGAFLLVVLAAALVGFVTSFDSPRFLAVGVVGAVAGISVAHFATALRWHWASTALLAAGLFFLLGGALALRADVIAGFVPSLTTLADLSRLSVAGWKELLTTLPPVDGGGQLLVLPYLIAVVAGAVGFSVARRSRNPYLAVAVPFATLALVVLLGTMQPPAVLLQGIAFSLGCFGWVVVRTSRRGRLAASGSSPRARLVSGRRCWRSRPSPEPERTGSCPG